MKNQNPLQRARDNIRKFVVRAEIQSYEYATLGKPDGTIRAPGVRRVYIVKDNNVATALNEANVPHNAGLPLKTRFENGSWVIKGIDSRASAALVNLPGDPYGVPAHPLTSHNDLVITSLADGEVIAWDAALNKWVNAAAPGGAVDSVNGQTGVVVLDTDDIAEGATNLYLTQERVEDYVGAMVASNTETGITVTYDDATGKLNFDAQTAGDLRYAPIAKGVTNGDSHDHNGGDGGTIAYSSLSGTPTVYTQEQIEDFVGAMVGGSETGISVTYDDGTGTLVFDAQTAGDARYGRLATANSWTQNQTIASTQTTGNALNVTRNLTATSTDAPVVSLIQDHASDDQAVLRIQQDGAAAIVNIYDTTDLVVQIADGGRVLLTPTATSGAALSVVRDLASASTDWPVVDLIQENSGDDQPLLQLRQDGTGNIVTFKDGVNTVFQVQDGGLVVINQVGTTGIGFSVNRNLAAASTNNVVAEFVQDNTGDDQAVLRVQQDGTGAIVELYDGATLVFSVKDGGGAVVGAGAPLGTAKLTVEGNIAVGSGVNSNLVNNVNNGVLSFVGGQAATDGAYVALAGTNHGTDAVRGTVGLVVNTANSTTGGTLNILSYNGVSTWLNRMQMTRAGWFGWGGVTVPQGLHHSHDGTGGDAFISKTGVVGSSVVMIPDGTGDVTKCVQITGVVTNSTPTNFDVAIRVDNNSNQNVDDGAGNRLTFTVAANGQLSVARSLGTATWALSVQCIWQ